MPGSPTVRRHPWVRMLLAATVSLGGIGHLAAGEAATAMTPLAGISAQITPGLGNPLRSRADMEQMVRELIMPVLGRTVPGGFHLGEAQAIYGERIARLEAFARVLWSIAPLTAGGGDFDIWPQMRRILMEGVGEGEGSWGPILPCPKDQRAVEMAAIATAILLAPQAVWEPLSGAQRQAVATWLKTIRDIQKMDNNWTFFRILTYTALRSVGEQVDEEQLVRDFATIDGCYLGDGWYSDGRTAQRDYYIAMAMHFYGLLYATVAGTRDPQHAQLYRARASRFAEDFMHWFTPEGDALPFGRSLTYRFAQGSFWSAMAFADQQAPGLNRGQIKGLLMRHLRWWFRQPIFSGDGLLTVGYRYPNALMAEQYNAPGSPYWAGKAFLVLALPETHPLWQTPEEPLPARAALSVQAHPGMVIVHDDARAHTWALACGQDAAAWLGGQAPKYGKFAYSTVFGFCTLGNQQDLLHGGFDSSLAVSDDNTAWRMRERSASAGTTPEGVAWSQWKPWHDVEITSWLRPAGAGHLRLHRVITGRQLQLADCGYSLPVSDNLEKAALTANGVLITNGAGSSGVTALLGDAQPLMTEPLPNLNLLHSLVRVPAVRWQVQPGEHWLATAVVGIPGPDSAREANSFIADATATLTEDQARVSDGHGITLRPPPP